MATHKPHKLFPVIYEHEWFDDPFVKKMVLDVDKTEIMSYKLAYDYTGLPMNAMDISGGVKSLIIMYKRPNLLINGNSMGDNCAKWIIEIGKMQNCYMILSYGMAFNEDVTSLDEFKCTILNNGKTITTIREFYTEYIKFPRDINDRLP
jgi:hypothetical protein